LSRGETRLTEEQKIAVEFEGNNLLVSAAAGSGKTFVLVERIIRKVLSKHEPWDIERLLVVTFTEKAALEMKERIRAALQEAREQNPDDLRIARQLSLLERAQISTIHSFCLSIVRRYFYRVDLDPGFRVLDPNEAELLRYEAVDEVFEQRYGSDSDEHRPFLALVQGYGGRGVDEGLKQIVLKLHSFLQTQPYPREWLDRALALYRQVEEALAGLGPARNRIGTPHEPGAQDGLGTQHEPAPPDKCEAQDEQGARDEAGTSDAREAQADPGAQDKPGTHDRPRTQDNPGAQYDLGRLVLALPWTPLLLEHIESELSEAISSTRRATEICRQPGGPESYLPVLEEELAALEDLYKTVQELVELSWKLTAGSGNGYREVGNPWAHDPQTKTLKAADDPETSTLEASDDPEINTLKAAVSKLKSLRSLPEFKFRALPGKKKGSDPELADMAKNFREKVKKRLKNCASNVLMRPAAEVLKEIADLRPVMETLVELVLDLDREYTRRKKGVSGVDFSDLERYTLDILRQEGGRLAEDIRACYDFVFVDEYQDTNPVQEEILSLVSRDNNLFMVGDIKQSIYRFRLADPTIFIRKYNAYAPIQQLAAGGAGPGGESPSGVKGASGAADVPAGLETPGVRGARGSEEVSRTTGVPAGADPHLMASVQAKAYQITSAPVEAGADQMPSVPGVRTGLSLNFRSRKQVIDAVNYLFSRIMRRSVAEIDYTDEHRLNLGASYPPIPGYDPTTELILVERENLNDGGDGSQGEEPTDPGAAGANGDSDVEQLEALEKEAMVVAWKIKQMVEGELGFRIWDGKTSQFRQCMFRDIAVFMRSTKDRANVVLDIFQKCGIPAYAELGTGYFRAREVEVALSLLSVIDNPRQDIPLASVLRSPVAGLTPRQLAIVKALCPGGQFCDSVMAFASIENQRPIVPDALKDELNPGEIIWLRDTLSRFLEDLDRWRTMSRRMPLAHVLWAVMGETGYYDYVGGLPGGAQRQANLRALVNRAMEFDSFGRHGLFRFLRFIDRIRESRGDLGTARALGEQENVVRVLSVHKSKGLEFPVVFVIDLGKPFNMEDLAGDFLFHRDLGIGTMYCDLENKVKYPSLPYTANQIQIRKDNLAEEMRILYVAMTRAREKLFLVGSARKIGVQMSKWQDMRLDRAQNHLDWICPCVLPELTKVLEQGTKDLPGEFPFDIQVFGLPGTPAVPQVFLGTRPRDETWPEVKRLVPLSKPADPEVYEQVRRRLEWEYPFRSFTYVPAKMSVSELKSRLDFEDEFQEFVPDPGKRLFSKTRRGRGIERGIAVHALLARMDLAKASDEEEVRREIQRLSAVGFLDSQYVRPEDVTRIAEFFRSDTGRMLMADPHKVKREIQFTIGIPVRGRRLVFDEGDGEGPADDSVVVQGIIDVIFEADDGLWIIDYKTDSVSPQQLPRVVQGYTPQLALYAYAAEKILNRPVVHVSLVFLTPGQEIAVDWRSYLSRLRLDEVLPLVRGREPSGST
jgi:ATP-dependent exoDNAse (exonuclease V) beta subunit